MKNEGEKELRERLMQYLLTRRDTGYPLDETCFDFFWAYIVELEARKEGEINKLHETIELYSEGQENFENWQVDVSAYKEKMREMIEKTRISGIGYEASNALNRLLNDPLLK